MCASINPPKEVCGCCFLPFCFHFDSYIDKHLRLSILCKKNIISLFNFVLKSAQIEDSIFLNKTFDHKREQKSTQRWQLNVEFFTFVLVDHLCSYVHSTLYGWKAIKHEKYKQKRSISKKKDPNQSYMGWTLERRAKSEYRESVLH